MIKYETKLFGNVFNGKNVDGRKQLTKAAYVTLQQGRKIVQGRTPAGSTGRLRKGWEIVAANAALENAVSYASYVELGTDDTPGVFYARDSVPEIEKLFEAMILKYSKQALGGE